MMDRRSIINHRINISSRSLMFGAAASLLICQTVFLVSGDSNIFWSSPTGYQPTPAVTSLQKAVGNSLVGLGAGSLGGLGLGLAPESNIPFGIHEFAEYDPIAPRTYFTDWTPINRTSPGVVIVYDFIPKIASATVARRYGISFLLEPLKAARPPGSVFDTRLGSEDLYRIPRAAAATLVASGSSTRWPSKDARGKAVHVQWPSPSDVRIVTDSPTPQVLRLRVASLPGWQATIDGRPLATSTYLSMMFQARIPAGRHVIELHYWPKRFTEGLAVAATTVAAFAAAAIISWRRKAAMGTSEAGPEH